MKQRTIQSQTTIPCNTEPKPSDYQRSWTEHFWPNVKDALMALCLIYLGYIVSIGITALISVLRGG
ncbi:hypothetical protein [Acinetobacter baumannii]